MKIAIVGGGWAGMAAAVELAGAHHDITVFEATRTLGGRARALDVELPDGTPITLDNGQHLLIGAYTETLALMQRVGMPPAQSLLRLPLSLAFSDGSGLQTPSWAAGWPAPLDAVAAIATATGWSWRERLALVRTSLAWQRAGFVCAPQLSVAALCAGLPQRVRDELIEPLCVSALNTAMADASAQVFLRVWQDALLGQGFEAFSASSMLLPHTDLSALFPEAAARWLLAHHEAHARLLLGTRIQGLHNDGTRWRLHGEGIGEEGGDISQPYDQVIWATAASPAALVAQAAAADPRTQAAHGPELADWAAAAAALDFTAITTVYAWGNGAHLRSPMLALRPWPDAQRAPAQFAFDRGQLKPNDAAMQGVLAFVVSNSSGERGDLQARVLQQAAEQLDLHRLQALQTVVEKRATFACTPGLQRPPMAMAPGLWAAGDYLQGPYPATLESAVRSGRAAAQRVQQHAPGTR
ncbi:hydroxysqualene dehydroxylase HpnE [Hydrogenophaga sp.]|uniref:hydroxysqualene dehydroxylase HpnE n=1 Tax=Hydrogenophaga sp. TaxID=1904254 RepID=UPI00356B0EB0